MVDRNGSIQLPGQVKHSVNLQPHVNADPLIATIQGPGGIQQSVIGGETRVERNARLIFGQMMMTLDEPDDDELTEALIRSVALARALVSLVDESTPQTPAAPQ